MAVTYHSNAEIQMQCPRDLAVEYLALRQQLATPCGDQHRSLARSFGIAGVLQP